MISISTLNTWIFKKGDHKSLGILPTQFHFQTLHQALLPNLILPCMHLQGHLQHQNVLNT